MVFEGIEYSAVPRPEVLDGRDKAYVCERSHDTAA